MDKRICVICGNEFQPKSHNQQVCMNEHTFYCPICNKPYIANRTQIKSFIKNGRMNCCSTKCSNEQIKRTKLEKYGDTNYNNKSKMLQTKLEKYGDTNYNNIEQIKSTKAKKYGNEKYNNREKFKATCKERFGTDTPLQNEDVLNKMLNTMNEKYGFNAPTMNEDIKQKITANNMSKYKVYNPTQSHYNQDTKNILFDKQKFLDFCEKYKNVMNYTLCADILNIQDTTFKSYYDKYNCSDIYPLKNIFTKELEIENILDQYQINYIKHDRKTIYPKELDYYIPEKKVAIEFNGTYWHSYAKIKDKQYHYSKSKLCESSGIRLIHIWEYEWNDNRQRPILENIIKNAIGVNEHRIYARKCSIEVKQSKDMRKFFDDNNIQGFRPGKFAICLKYNNEIVMAYMMGNAFFGKGKYEWEVIRGATKLGYTIVGGASKIFNYFIKTYNPQSCVYYIDYNYFNGNSLKNLPNMKFIKTQSSFKNWWVSSNEIKSRNPSKHKEIKQLYESGDVIPIYNAGTKVYVWEKDK